MVRFVNVAVPEDLVEDVYALVAARRGIAPDLDSGASAVGAGDEGNDSSPSPSVWDEARIRELFQISTPATTKIIKRVAAEPEIGLPTPELTSAAGFKSGRAMGGWVARVRMLCSSRWGLPLPIVGYWDDELGHYRWRMEPGLAQVVRQIDAE